MARKKSIKKPVFAAILSVAVLAMLFYYTRIREAPSYAHYPGFGINIPANYIIHGIDVSRYQGKIAWNLVKEMKEDDIRIGFAFIKATEGLNNVDPEFRRNWRESKKNGLIRGAYHFMIPSKSGKQQAAKFISKVKISAGDLPPVLDIEESYGTPTPLIRKHVAEWLSAVQLYYDVTPVIYTNIDFYRAHLAGYFDEYPLWIAHYRSGARPRITRQWHFWQHSETGRVNGISNNVDFNVFNGDSTDFLNLLTK